MSIRSTSPSVDRIPDEYNEALEYVNLQMKLLEEINSIGKNNSNNVAIMIFNRVLRATQEFRKIYGSNMQEEEILDPPKTSLSRTVSQLLIPGVHNPQIHE